MNDADNDNHHNDKYSYDSDNHISFISVIKINMVRWVITTNDNNNDTDNDKEVNNDYDNKNCNDKNIDDNHKDSKDNNNDED